MYDTQYPSMKEFVGQQRLRRNFILALFTATLGAIFGVMVWIAYNMPRVHPPMILALGVLAFTCLVVPVVIWNYPRAGLFIVFAATTLLPADPRSINQHKFTSNFPFFLNLNNVGELYGIGGLGAFKFSPAELLVVLSLLAWLIRGIGRREVKFERGPFLPVLLLFAATTTMGYLHGVGTGGDPVMALWEARAQFYPLLLYMLATNLITERKHVVILLWMAFIGLSLLSLVGVASYFQQNGAISDQGVLDHEDSLIFNVFFLLMIYLKLNGGNRRMVQWGCVFLPTVLFSFLENHRRAGTAAFVIAFAASLPMMYVMFEERRRQIAGFIIAIVVASAIYIPAGWNQGSAAWAQPAQAIRSNFSPSDRDTESNQYREIEDYDLNFTRNLSPIIGYGYGKPYMQPRPLPMVSTDFLKFFAHDSVLWIWMRTGHIGFFVFMMFMATVSIRGLQICRQTRDPLLQAAGMMAVMFVLMSFIYGKYDLQLTNYRTMMMLGVWIGIIGALPNLNRARMEAAPPQTPAGLEDEDAYSIKTYSFGSATGMLEGDPL